MNADGGAPLPGRLRVGSLRVVFARVIDARGDRRLGLRQRTRGRSWPQHHRADHARPIDTGRRGSVPRTPAALRGKHRAPPTPSTGKPQEMGTGFESLWERQVMFHDLTPAPEDLAKRARRQECRVRPNSQGAQPSMTSHAGIATANGRQRPVLPAALAIARRRHVAKQDLTPWLMRALFRW
jgi:hypothetical protein